MDVLLSFNCFESRTVHPALHVNNVIQSLNTFTYLQQQRKLA
jgi:hypothetical protein